MTFNLGLPPSWSFLPLLIRRPERSAVSAGVLMKVSGCLANQNILERYTIPGVLSSPRVMYGDQN